MTDYFRAVALEKEGCELTLQVEAIFGGVEGFFTARNFVLMLVGDSFSDSELGRDVTRQLCLNEWFEDGDVFEGGLRTIACHYVEDVRIVSTEGVNETRTEGERGTVLWDGGAHGERAVYRLRFTSPSWSEHISPGDEWMSGAYDTSNTEEFYLGYIVEVLEKDGTHLVLRVTSEDDLDPDVPESARFVLGILLERARVGGDRSEAPLAHRLPDVDVENDEMVALAPEFVESVKREVVDAAARVSRLDVVVTDKDWVSHVELGMRWAAYGFS
jgi:hypothetical protein